MSTGAIIAIVVVVVLVVAAAVFLLMPQMRSQRLRRRFGPEYDRLVSDNGDRRAVEKELADRERRHSEYELRAIPMEKRDQYRAEWTGVQERFVDDPVDAVAKADRLVNVVVAELGYPSEGHDRQLADLSVRHAHTVEHYRSAYEVRVRQEATTEELRNALIGYRKLFSDLLDNGVAERHSKQDKTEAVQRG
jgi:hypothetical protein